MVGTKLDFIANINGLVKSARKGDDNLPNEICNLITSEYELQAAVLFKVADNNLIVLGKSSGARKNYLSGSSFSCSSCKLLGNSPTATFHTDTNCEIQISEFLIYESCSVFRISDMETGFFKFAKKSPFTKSDKEALEAIYDLIGFLLVVWINARGGNISISETSFSNVVFDAAQELRNPANSIIGFTTILTQENLSSSQSEYINTIKKNAQSLLLNINDLGDISKLESGAITQNARPVNVALMLNEIVDLFKSKLSGKPVEFHVNVDKKLYNSTSVDDQKLRYIITNLLLVSSLLTPKGEITAKASLSGDNKITFTISDTGKGLHPEISENFFNPFVATKIDELKNSSLTGMSLHLVKRYISFLGGDISVTANSAKGTTFSFTINGEVMSDLESNLTHLPKASSKNKVLVIEDDYATSKLLSNYLNKWGYDPTIVNSEDQTFSQIEKEEFLAVILDIELPDVNGLELLKKLHDNPKTKNVPVIVCSIEPEQQKAFMMGAVEYFIKPINYNYLVEVLTSYKLRKNSNILCVDDDLPTLNLVKQAIESAGFNAIAENISANVLANIADKEVDLAIVDLDMPHPNGFELIKMIKSESRYANLPIIIYTGKENYKEDLSKIEGLFEELLDKRSTNIEDLADTIKSMINRYEEPPAVEDVLKKDNVIKILLAEDYKHSQIIVTRLLKKNGFENIVVVENGEAALEYATQQSFDLILMDMQMPIMNGFEATEKIRRIPKYKSTPIIALTAFAMKGDREKCLEAGATDYIPKPIDSKEFIEKVKYYTVPK